MILRAKIPLAYTTTHVAILIYNTRDMTEIIPYPKLINLFDILGNPLQEFITSTFLVVISKSKMILKA